MAIKTEGLSKTYSNGVKAVTDLDLTVDKGTVFGFLGPNGAGKTTTVRLLNGTLSPSNGHSSVLGIDSSHSEIRRRTATLSESARMYDHLTAKQNLSFFAALYDIPHAESKIKISELLNRMGLEGRANEKLGSFSTGMKKRIQLARTLLHSPELLFLDEPTSGLDPESSAQVNSLIRRLADDTGVTVFLCTHNLPLAQDICDAFGFIKEGKLMASGTAGELTKGLGKARELQIETTSGSETFPLESKEEINTLVKKVIDSGKALRSVNIIEPDLEEVYFHYIGRSKDELA